MRHRRVNSFPFRHDDIEPAYLAWGSTPVYKAGDPHHAANCLGSLTMNESYRKLAVILSGVTDSDEGRCVGHQFNTVISAELI